MRVIATGNFDGLHLGHRKILGVMESEAQRLGLDSVAVTYEPHTRHYLGTPGLPPLLTPLQEKKRLFQEMGISLEVLPFDQKLAGLSATDFVEKIVIGQLGASVWVFGPNHRFGVGGKGSIKEVQGLFPQLGIVQVPPMMFENAEVSSSRIRKALEIGDCALVKSLMDRPYALCGRVISGDARGRQIGFPTANLQLEPYKLLPPFGVYAGFVEIDEISRIALVNVGVRPTFNGQNASIEVHIPDWSGDLYGKTLEMKLNLKLRGEMRFSSVEALVAQIACDVQRAKSMIQ